MATVKTLQPVLRILENGKAVKELPMIAGMTAQQCLDHYSNTEPQLASALVQEPFIEDGQQVYHIKPGEDAPKVKGGRLVHPVTRSVGTNG